MRMRSVAGSELKAAGCAAVPSRQLHIATAKRTSRVARTKLQP